MNKTPEITSNGLMKVTKDFTVFVDVDNTIMISTEHGERGLYKAIKFVKQLHEKGFELYCWSQAGAAYAEKACEFLGIKDLFKAFLPKPNMCLDDRPMSDWCNQWMDAKKLNEY